MFDLTGQRFGRTVALRFMGGPKTLWECRCDCGRLHFVSTGNLRAENLRAAPSLRSCGCVQRELSRQRLRGNRNTRLDLTGSRFGRLTAMENTGRTKNDCLLWKCQCDCGGTAIVRSGDLRAGVTNSCGCLRSESARKLALELQDVPVRLQRLLERAQSLSATFAHGNAYERFLANKGEVENGNQGSGTA